MYGKALLILVAWLLFLGGIKFLEWLELKE